MSIDLYKFWNSTYNTEHRFCETRNGNFKVEVIYVGNLIAPVRTNLCLGIRLKIVYNFSTF